MNSTRLPKKVLRNINGNPMLEYVIKQTLSSKLIKNVIIATTEKNDDLPIIKYCKKNNLMYYRGSSDDLLDRYYKCAKKFKCKTIIRITSDCPLIDPKIIDEILKKFLNNSYDYISNNIEKIDGKWENATCNFPQGMTVEVSSFEALEKAWKKAKKPSEREHVFPYIQFNSELFKISNVKMKNDFSHIRCTVDKSNDLKFVRKIYEKMKNEKIVTIKDIIKIIDENPKLIEINSNTKFDEGYQKSLIIDKKHGFKI
jgi:spore coat polysaccharide biosynthesis protein SpsF (cytidylyltransferase family)